MGQKHFLVHSRAVNESQVMKNNDRKPIRFYSRNINVLVLKCLYLQEDLSRPE